MDGMATTAARLISENISALERPPRNVTLWSAMLLNDESSLPVPAIRSGIWRDLHASMRYFTPFSELSRHVQDPPSGCNRNSLRKRNLAAKFGFHIDPIGGEASLYKQTAAEFVQSNEAVGHSEAISFTTLIANHTRDSYGTWERASVTAMDNAPRRGAFHARKAYCSVAQKKAIGA